MIFFFDYYAIILSELAMNRNLFNALDLRPAFMDSCFYYLFGVLPGLFPLIRLPFDLIDPDYPNYLGDWL